MATAGRLDSSQVGHLERGRAHRHRHSVTEEGVQGKEHREVGDDADDRRGDAGQRRREGVVAAEPLDVGGPGEDEDEARHERDPGGQERREDRGCPGVEGAGRAVGTDESDELHHHDEWTRSGLGQGEASHHLAGCQPRVDLDGTLGHVGQYGIRAPKVTSAAPEKNNAWSVKILCAPVSHATRPTGRPQANSPRAMTRTVCDRMGLLVVERVVGDQRRGSVVSLAVALGGPMVCGAHRPSPHPTPAAAATTTGMAPRTLRGPRMRPRPGRSARGARGRVLPPGRRLGSRSPGPQGPDPAKSAVTTRVSPAATYRPDNTREATTPGRTNRLPATRPPRTPLSSHPT